MAIDDGSPGWAPEGAPAEPQGSQAAARPQGAVQPQVEALLHELSVHQAELQIQNEELRRSQVDLETSRHRWYQLFEQAPVAYLAVGGDGVIQEVNAAAAGMLGPRDALRGRALSRLAGGDDQLRLHRLVTGTWARRTAGRETLRLRPLDGDERHVEASAATVESPAGPQVLVVLHDVTERWRAEEERRALAAQVVRLQKLDALGRMAGAMAHEINNVLTVVMSTAAVQTEHLHGQPGGPEAEEILAAARRGRDLTQKLLGFARATPVRLEPLRLPEVAAEAATLLSRLGRGLVDYRVEAPAPVRPVAGDRTQLHQAILNLGLNAADAIGERGGRVTIRISEEALGPDGAAGRGGLAPGPYARLEVADDGPGFGEAALAHAFEPFFTTKAVGHGTGLGLAMVFGTARDHHGHAAVVSRPGEGGRVVLHLPLHLEAAPPAAAPAARGGPEAGGLALVVDDEPALRGALRRMLTRFGWEVVLTASGPEALERARELGPRIGVVLLDMLMPGMSGLETLRALRALDPGVPVLLCSGYSHERVPPGLLDAPCTAFLAKPFEPAELEAAVRQLARRHGPPAQA